MDVDYVVLPALILLIAIAVVWLGIRRICSDGLRSLPLWRRIAERTLLSVGILLVGMAGLSSAYNAIVLYRARHPAPGGFYAVNGHRMRIECAGSGSPTVILETGAGGTGMDWAGVQPELAKTTHVCTYDRAGMGWSDEQPGPHDADHVAAQLHELLKEFKIAGPFVLVGASLGGLFIRDYTTHHPAEVSGLILVDARPPLLGRNPIVKSHDAKAASTPSEVLLARAEFILGIPRLLGACSYPIAGLDARAARMRHADQCHQSFNGAEDEMAALDLSDHEGERTGPYGDVPILILSADIETEAARGRPRDLLKVGDQMQEDLKALSTRSLRIIAKGSGHRIVDDRPDLLEEQITLFVQQIRGASPQPSNYGSTVVR